MILKIQKKGVLFECIYDEADQDLILGKTWGLTWSGYAYTFINCKQVLMHRYLLGLTDPKIGVDHKNRNRLDNRRENLRIASQADNIKNRTAYGRSKYLGVTIYSTTYKDKTYNYIKASIQNKHLGMYKSEEDAARAYDATAEKLYGEFANLNFK